MVFVRDVVRMLNRCKTLLFTEPNMLPVQILKDNAQEERGESARLSSFVGAIAIGDLVKSTLGPKGMVCVLSSAILNSGLAITSPACV